MTRSSVDATRCRPGPLTRTTSGNSSLMSLSTSLGMVAVANTHVADGGAAAPISGRGEPSSAQMASASSSTTAAVRVSSTDPCARSVPSRAGVATSTSGASLTARRSSAPPPTHAARSGRAPLDASAAAHATPATCAGGGW